MFIFPVSYEPPPPAPALFEWLYALDLPGVGEWAPCAVSFGASARVRSTRAAGC